MTHTRYIRILSLLLAWLCVTAAVLPLAGCTSRADRQNQKVVATCNGFDILYEELRFLTLFYKDTMAATYGEDIWDDPTTAESYRAELETMVKEHLKENYVILTTCQAYYVDLEDKDADTYADTQIKIILESECGGRKKDYRDWLTQNHMTDNYLRFSLKVSFLDSVLYYTLLDNHFFHYDSTNIDEYIEYVLNSPEYARTIHVFIRNDEGEDVNANRTEAENISRALRAVANPEQRQSIMGDYIGSAVNDDLDLVSGDGYYFTKGEMDPAYEEAVFALEVGDVSEPFECSGGYFVVMRLAPEESYVIPNCATLIRNYQSSMLGLLEDTFRDSCVVEYNEYGQSIDLLTIR